MGKIREPSQKRAQQRVALILDAATEVLRTSGVSAFSTNSIAAQANIPVSSIYQYFPSKVEIICKLYEEYLENIYQALEQFVTAERLEQHWELFFAEFHKVIYRQETRGNINLELENALGLFPELVELDNRHRRKVANLMADILHSLGSDWTKPRLRRLGHFIYEINGAVWSYRSMYPSPARDHREWGSAAALGVIRECMPG